jgi:hypothetical protein
LVKENRQSNQYNNIVQLFLDTVIDILKNRYANIKGEKKVVKSFFFNLSETSREYVLKTLKYSEIIFHIRRYLNLVFVLYNKWKFLILRNDSKIKETLLEVMNYSFKKGDYNLKYVR